MIKKEILNTALIVSFGTASLFIYGLTFYQGYLNFWGIEESLFPLSFERTLFQGFIASSYLGAKAIGPMFLISVVCFAALLFFNWIAKKFKSTKWFARLKKDAKEKEEEGELSFSLKYSGLFVIFSYWALIAFFGMMFLLTFSTNTGKGIAKDQYRKYSEGNEIPITLMLKGKKMVKAHTIICSSTHGAFLIEDRVRIIPLIDISAIESKPKLD